MNSVILISKKVLVVQEELKTTHSLNEASGEMFVPLARKAESSHLLANPTSPQGAPLPRQNTRRKQLADWPVTFQADVGRVKCDFFLEGLTFPRWSYRHMRRLQYRRLYQAVHACLESGSCSPVE